MIRETTQRCLGWSHSPLPFVIIALAIMAAGCVAYPEAVVLVDYQRTGGIGGFNDHLVIYSNGNATVSRTTGTVQFTMTSSEIRNLQGLFEAANFSSLNASYPAPSPGADYFQYSITYHGKTVTTEDTGVPDDLVPIINVLDQIIATHSP